MRVLHICHLFGTELEGGVQSYVAGLLRQQADGGHQVAVLTGSLSYDGPAREDRSVVDGVEVTTVHRVPDERWSGDFGSPRIGALVDDVIREFRPELCHVHHWQGLTNDLVRRCVSQGVKVVVTLHDLFTTCPLFFRMRVEHESCASELPLSECARCLLGGMEGIGPEELEQLLERRHEEMQLELQAASRVTTMSRYMRDRLQAVPYFRREEVDVLPIGVMHDGLEAVSGPEPVVGRLRIANWAGLAPRKGLHVLLEGLAASSRASSFEVHIHGSTDNTAYMEQLRLAAGDLDVRWHGSFHGVDALRDIARTCDVAAFPSLEEPYGLAQDEAMLLGMPLVVSDQGAPRERVGARGVLVPAGDPAAWGAAFEELLGHPERRSAMRDAPGGGRRIQEHFPELMLAYRQALTV